VSESVIEQSFVKITVPPRASALRSASSEQSETFVAARVTDWPRHKLTTAKPNSETFRQKVNELNKLNRRVLLRPFNPFN
jgi:hypothetical protein